MADRLKSIKTQYKFNDEEKSLNILNDYAR